MKPSLAIAAVFAVLFTVAVWWALYQHRIARIFDAALTEQLRREKVALEKSHAHYRPEQRVQAMQDRLTRKLGRRRGRSKRMKRRIIAGLEAADAKTAGA